MPERRTILIAGGGTGGHVFPGLALADAITRRAPDVALVWVGTRGRLEERAVPAAGHPIEFVEVAYLKGRRGLELARALAALPVAGATAIAIARRHRPVAVIGVGGYASGPICAVAALSGTPVFVLEQNARPGATNRLLARVADTVYASFEGARPSFGGAVVKVLGNPIRADIVARAARRRPGRTIDLLVLGGSQGARILNEQMPAIVAALRAAGTPVRVRHAAGESARQNVERDYRERGVDDARVEPFIEDMAGAYANADFVVARAGATTIAELTAVGIPALLVPFALAADDHQTANALAVVEAGGAVMVPEAEFGPERAVRLLAPILADPGILDRMSAASRAIGRPDAADAIARDILEQLA